MSRIKVIDFFCGAGGFSEGFRQQGFDIVMGIENWKPAVMTHNLNHGLNDEAMDILYYEGDVDRIFSLPDTEIIIGSPPCVTFSMSNKAGKADKSLGLRLIEVFLRIVAVKKYQKGSILKAWLMENVPNSRNFVNEHYSFNDLNLGDWATTIGKKPFDIALNVKNNGAILIAADYGSPQSRQRFICGEIVNSGKFPIPKITHFMKLTPSGSKPYKTLGEIKRKMPSPIDVNDNSVFVDPNYPPLKVNLVELTDHFYDTGLFQVEWEMARYAKENHPFMGKMSFPEDENRPCRTIMATRSASTREAIIFKSEKNRKGDGEYRLPTIREISTLMGFPYTYQFTGGESTKWKQIGNAVCPHMSAALAKAILLELNKEILSEDKLNFDSQRENYLKINDLRNPELAEFKFPPKKKKGTKFRMHPFKGGNMTVELTNFDVLNPDGKTQNGQKWYCHLFIGSGKNYRVIQVTKSIESDINNLLNQQQDGLLLTTEFYEFFDKKIAKSNDLQRLLEENIPYDNQFYGPGYLIRMIADFINERIEEKAMINFSIDGYKKQQFPKKQFLAIWAVSQAVSVINSH